MTLLLTLTRVPNVLGIYGTKPIGAVAAGDYFPPSAALLHPEASESYRKLEQETGKKLRISDMFRSAEMSLQALQQKSGVQPPGFSAHNFGMAIDVAVDACLSSFALTKEGFDSLMARYGWYCHRKDHKLGFEAWHYNFLGAPGEAVPYLAACASHTNTAAGIELKLQSAYGGNFEMSTADMQARLKRLGLYGGDVDGDFGPRTRTAVLAFERAWKLPEDGTADLKMQRTLAFVTAEKLIIS
jgi:Putative peptidoglycan binding domain/D-alanyl-D-alanine carboxypeptidase